MRKNKLLKLLGVSLSLLFFTTGAVMLQTIGWGWAPWSTRAEAANHRNPCAPKRSNPCNPCSAKRANPCNPRTAKAANPCNPCSAKRANPRKARGKRKQAKLIGWGKNYVIYERTTGFVSSASHGGRLVVSYVAPKRPPCCSSPQAR